MPHNLLLEYLRKNWVITADKQCIDHGNSRRIKTFLPRVTGFMIELGILADDLAGGMMVAKLTQARALNVRWCVPPRTFCRQRQFRAGGGSRRKNSPD